MKHKIKVKSYKCPYCYCENDITYTENNNNPNTIIQCIYCKKYFSVEDDKIKKAEEIKEMIIEDEKNHLKAFPYPAAEYLADGINDYKYNGMDLRDYFAIRLMQPLIKEIVYKTVNEKKYLIESAYYIADLMMKIREE